MKPRHTSLGLLLGLFLLLGAGCDGVRLADSVDLELNFSPLSGPSDRLHSPYVAGADFDVFTINLDAEDEVGWRIDSADPSVIAIEETLGDGSAGVSAVGPGEVDLLVRDETGQEVHRSAVEVVQPDRAALSAHGPLLVGRPELQPETTDELRVLVGGQATFLVEWFAGQDSLAGHGALSARSDEGVVVEPRQTFVFEDREWVTFTVLEPGPHTVELLANGELTRTITVLGVAEEAIDAVRLHGMDETNAEEGEELVVYAQAYDVDETPIYGVEYSWDLDGLPADGLGDLFRYRFAPGVTAELCARHGELEAIAFISATEGFVDSTNSLGCSVGGAEPGWLGAPVAALLFSLVWMRRRRTE